MSDSPDIKDFGKFPFEDSELRGVVGLAGIPTLTPNSEILVLKTLADRLFKEAEQLEKQKQEIVTQLVAVNTTLRTKIAEYKVNSLKTTHRGQNGTGTANGKPHKPPTSDIVAAQSRRH
jgi:hypothetical protein